MTFTSVSSVALRSRRRQNVAINVLVTGPTDFHNMIGEAKLIKRSCLEPAKHCLQPLHLLRSLEVARSKNNESRVHVVLACKVEEVVDVGRNRDCTPLERHIPNNV